MIVMRALEKKPEDRYQSAREFAEDLQRFLQDSGARMRSHHQLARYLRQIYSPEAEAQITEDGLLQARIFAEGDEDGQRGGIEALDFDQAPSDGPGAALARALRAAGPALWVDGPAAADSRGEPPSAEQSLRQDSAAPAATENGQGTSVSSNAELGSADVALSASESVPASRQTPVVARVSRVQKALAKEDNVPRSVPIGAVLFVAVLLAAAVAGLVWLLRGG
jgi:hypothetical protein